MPKIDTLNKPFLQVPPHLDTIQPHGVILLPMGTKIHILFQLGHQFCSRLGVMGIVFPSMIFVLERNSKMTKLRSFCCLKSILGCWSQIFLPSLFQVFQKVGVLILGHFLSDGLDEIFPLDKVANIVEVALSEVLQTMISILELTSGIDTRQPVISFLELFQFFHEVLLSFIRNIREQVIELDLLHSLKNVCAAFDHPVFAWIVMYSSKFL